MTDQSYECPVCFRHTMTFHYEGWCPACKAAKNVDRMAFRAFAVVLLALATISVLVMVS